MRSEDIHFFLHPLRHGMDGAKGLRAERYRGQLCW